MHPEAYDFVKRTVAALPPRRYVVDLGARVVAGGNIKDLFPGAIYVGVDIRPGRGVGVITDAAEYTPKQPVDAVVCTEVFEHTRRGLEICANAYRMLEPGGYFLTTMAMDPRAPHSAIDGMEIRPGEGEWYANVEPWELEDWLKRAGFRAVDIALTVDTTHGDLYAVAHKE